MLHIQISDLQLFGSVVAVVNARREVELLGLSTRHFSVRAGAIVRVDGEDRVAEVLSSAKSLW